MAETVRFEHYEVRRREDGTLWELGRGAMGITYRAFDTNLRTDVALKVINAAQLASPSARERFLREARAAAAIRHANVATVYHLGQADDAFFYAMEFIDGETLEDLMDREGALPTLLALDVTDQVARALGTAEKRGLVHRDIKPANLMLTRDEDDDLRVRVIDFGLAKAADRHSGFDAATITQGGFLGTPHFASPEQLDEAELDVRSDIYSLGVTLYYLLAGKAPFSGSVAQVMSQHLHRDPPLTAVADRPTPVLALLKTMLAKAPSARPPSASALRTLIGDCIAQVRDVRHASITTLPDAEWSAAPSLADHGFLPSAEAMTILTSIAGGLEALQRAGLPVPKLTTAKIKLLPGPADTTQPRFLAATDATTPDPAPVRSLAAIAYELFDGSLRDPAAIEFAPIPDLPAAANRVLRRAFDPTKGYPSPIAFVADLGDAVGDPCGVVSAPAASEVTIPPPEDHTPPIDRVALARAPRRRVPAWVGALGGLLALALLALLALFYSLRLPPELRFPPETTPPPPTPTPSLSPPPEPTPDPTPTLVPFQAPSATPSPIDPVVRRAASLAAANRPGVALDILAQAWERDRANEAIPAEMERIAATLRDQPLADESFADLEDALQRAAEAHSESAQLLLAERYREADPALFIKYATIAENDGSPAGARLMAEAYELGIGVDPDPTRALEYRRRAGEFLPPTPSPSPTPNQPPATAPTLPTPAPPDNP